MAEPRLDPGFKSPFPSFKAKIRPGLHINAQYCPLESTVKNGWGQRAGQRGNGRDRLEDIGRQAGRQTVAFQLPVSFTSTQPTSCETHQDSHMTHSAHRQRTKVPGVLALYRKVIIELRHAMNMSKDTSARSNTHQEQLHPEICLPTSSKLFKNK